MNQKQHLQSIGQSGVFPPFPMFSSYSVYIFTPPSTFFVEGISPSFAVRSFCSIFHCFFSFRASFFYDCYFLPSADDFSRVCSVFYSAFYCFFALKISSMMLSGFLMIFYQVAGLEIILALVLGFYCDWRGSFMMNLGQFQVQLNNKC